MGKLLLWIIVGMLVMLLVRMLGASARARRQGGQGRRGGQDAAPGTSAPTQDVILACHVCGVHLPASEAMFAHGRVYCCEEHCQQDRGALEHKTLH